MRRRAISKEASSTSMPVYRLLASMHAIPTVPEPMNGSRIGPSMMVIRPAMISTGLPAMWCLRFGTAPRKTPGAVGPFRGRAPFVPQTKDGLPNIASIMKMQDYWADYYDYIENKVTAEQLFDIEIAKEALARSRSRSSR